MIFEFLPKEYKKTAKKLYYSKVISLYAAGGIFIFVASVPFLLPSYVYVKFEKKSVVEEIKILEQKMSGSKEVDARQFIDLAKNKISKVKESSNKKLFTEALSRVTNNVSSSISVTEITFERGNESNQIRLSGVARTRDSLLAFMEVLKTENLFSSVDLPVSNLAKSTNIVFSISITASI